VSIGEGFCSMCGARVCACMGVATNQSSLKSSTCGGFCALCGERVCAYMGVATNQSSLQAFTCGGLCSVCGVRVCAYTGVATNRHLQSRLLVGSFVQCVVRVFART